MTRYILGLVSGLILGWIGLSLYGIWPFLVATFDEAMIKIMRRFGRKL